MYNFEEKKLKKMIKKVLNGELEIPLEAFNTLKKTYENILNNNHLLITPPSKLNPPKKVNNYIEDIKPIKRNRKKPIDLSNIISGYSKEYIDNMKKGMGDCLKELREKFSSGKPFLKSSKEETEKEINQVIEKDVLTQELCIF